MAHKLPPLKIKLAIVGTLIVLFTIIYIFSKCERELKNIEASGTVEIKKVDITSRVSSKIKKIYVDKGKEVKKGDILLELDSQVIKAQLDAAQSMYANAEKNYLRGKELYRANAISKQNYEQIESGYFTAKANYEQAKMFYEDTQPQAPWDGIILNRYVEEGELVSPNAPLLTIGDLKEVKITFYVSLKVLGKIKYGQRVKIKIDSYKGKIYEGRITYISDKAEFTPKNIQTKDERIKEVFAIEAGVHNENHDLKPGMPCDVIIDIGR